MADKAEKKPEGADKAPAGDKKDAGHGGKEKAAGGFLTKMPVMLGGVMIIEAVVLFAGFKFLGAGAKPAQGADITADTPSEHSGGTSEHGTEGGGAAPVLKGKFAVIKVTEFKASNKKNGTTFLYDMRICVTTKSEFQKRVEEAIAQKEPLIQDRIRTIIAQSDPEKLSGGLEPGLETLRRMIKHQLVEIICDGVLFPESKNDDEVIDQVLVPRWVPFRTDY